jgi:triosephosphate isomerase (TIM)
MSDVFGAARRPIVAANWKMNTTPSEARDLAARIVAETADLRQVEVVICPPAISILVVRDAVDGAVGVGAQNVYWKDSGAYTGEISPASLVGLAQYTIIGHSERRQYFGETDESVSLKVRAALSHGLTPIVCVGETLQQREAGLTGDLIALQVRGALHGLSSGELAGIVVAYEPVWAIGTGMAASGPDANAVAIGIRKVLADIGGVTAGQAVRIQYGGSVTAANAAEFLQQPDIDGALVGGASLKPKEFAGIVKAAIH